MLHKDLDALTADDIQRLYLDAHQESGTLAFKGRLDFESESVKAGLARDVSAMANASGGFLLIGLATDPSGKMATGLDVLRDPSAVERLDQIVAAAVSPRPRYRIRWLDMGTGGVAVIRIWPSDRQLHMVTAYESTMGRYYQRFGHRAQLMPEPTVRAVYERMFHLEADGRDRVRRVVAEELKELDSEWFSVLLVPMGTKDDSVDIGRVSPKVLDADDLIPDASWRRPDLKEMRPSAAGLEVRSRWGLVRLRRDGTIHMGTDTVVDPIDGFWRPFRIIQYCLCACRMARHAWPILGIDGSSQAVAHLDLRTASLAEGTPFRLEQGKVRQVQHSFDSRGPNDGQLLARLVLDRLFQEMGQATCPWFSESGQLTEEARKLLFD